MTMHVMYNVRFSSPGLGGGGGGGRVANAVYILEKIC